MIARFQIEETEWQNEIPVLCVRTLAYVRPCFDDPNGEKVDPGVANLLSKNQSDPTVNK